MHFKANSFRQSVWSRFRAALPVGTSIVALLAQTAIADPNVLRMNPQLQFRVQHFDSDSLQVLRHATLGCVPTPHGEACLKPKADGSFAPKRFQGIFGRLWSAYPNGQPEAVKKQIGGEIDAGWITNTCVIRASRALNYSGETVKPTKVFNTLTGKDKHEYGFRVAEFTKYLIGKYGPPSVTVQLKKKDKNGPALLRKAVQGKKGIIVFVVAWADATGHADLWDGQRAAHEAYFEEASQVYLWE